MDNRKSSFLSERKLAIVGISATKGLGNVVFHELKKQGYIVYPVSRTAHEIDGVKCFYHLEEIPDVVGGVVTVVPPFSTENIVEDCARLGIGKMWMQPGSESSMAIELARGNGIEAVTHACIMMYAKPFGIHKIHSWVNKLVGKY